jgi:hypothetical protein
MGWFAFFALVAVVLIAATAAIQRRIGRRKL